MVIGIDFDNTIVCYDEVFRRAAIDLELVPVTVPRAKRQVRAYLRDRGREDDWTRLQAHVYGVMILEAPAFPGVLEFLVDCRARGIDVYVISHKTRRPVMGDPHDLRRVAHEWLEVRGFYDTARTGLSPGRVYFEPTKELKLERIARVNCTYFVDDLPEFLLEPDFPAGVERILFDPSCGHKASSELYRATSWSAVSKFVPTGSGALKSETLRRVASCLMNEVGVRGRLTIEPVEGGANNQVFKLCSGRHAAILKVYFQHDDDPRDRLDSEYRFTRFAWNHDVRCVPQPLACDLEHRVALYEYVEGRLVTQQDVDETLIRQARDFYRSLNACNGETDAADLPLASEAYFTLSSHLRGVDDRVRELANIGDAGDVGRVASSFVEELTETWSRVKADTRTAAHMMGLSLEAELPVGSRRLSPSDFGFHNAILEPEGHIRFVDFEYAGWDDPAKLVCDFFCQEAVPIPEMHFDWFVSEMVDDLPDPAMQRKRIDLLLPVYRIKWCCILLNEFLPVGSARRRFVHSGPDEAARKSGQLEKARRAIRRVAGP